MKKLNAETMRGLYNAISLRERLLLTAFTLTAAIIWLTSELGALSDNFRKLSSEGKMLKAQNEVIRERESIERSLSEALARLDPSQTYNASQLVGVVDDIARQASLSYSINSPKTNTGETFNEHTVRVQIKNSDLKKLILFDNKIKEFSPYLGVDLVQMAANKRDPRQLDAQFEISSFELLRND